MTRIDKNLVIFTSVSIHVQFSLALLPMLISTKIINQHTAYRLIFELLFEMDTYINFIIVISYACILYISIV